MGDAVLRLLGQFFGPEVDAWSYTLVFSGLVLAVAGSLRFLTDRPRVRVTAATNAHVGSHGANQLFRGWAPAVAWPLGLIWLGMFIGMLGAFLWTILIGIVFAASVVLAIKTLLRSTRRGDHVSPTVMGLLLSFAAVFLFGSLFVTRLVAGRDPKTYFTGQPDIVGDSARGTFTTVLLAPLAMLAALIGVRVLTRNAKVQSAWSRLCDLTARHFTWVTLTCGLLTVVLYAAPKFGPGAPLTLFGVATPELGRITYLLTLALILARYGVLYRRYASIRPGQETAGATGLPPRFNPVAYVNVWGPLALFAAIAVACGIRKDVGPLVPIFIATIATIFIVVGHQAVRALSLSSGDARHRARSEFESMLRYPRAILVTIGVLTVMMVAAIPLTNGYLGSRVDAWKNPWAYPWATACTEAPAGETPPQGKRVDPATGNEVTVNFPDDVAKPCLQSWQAVDYSRKSQMAQSLSIIADGGLWGRGLSSSESGRVPAVGNDLVLAAIWSKLGGIVVALLSVLLALLSYSLIKLGLSVRSDAPAAASTSLSATAVFTVGLGWLILGQYVFQVMMTVNVFPHSGVTAPFLSQGAQASLSLVAGIVGAVWAVYAAAGGTPEAADDPQPSGSAAIRPKLPATAGALIVILVLIAAITVSPYQGLSEDRPQCVIADPSDPRVDPVKCSTDAVAFDLQHAVLWVDGRPAFIRGPIGWRAVDGGSVTASAMASLLQPGVIDVVVESVIRDTARGPGRTGLASRLLPPVDRPDDAVVELTIDPDLQAKLATVASTPGADGSDLLPAGIVVIDAPTGEVMSSVSVPTRAPAAESSTTPTGTGDEERGEYNETQYEAWFIDGQKVDHATCEKAAEQGELCGRWLAERPTGAVSSAPDELYDYVGGDRTVRAPSDVVDRALGLPAGLGSAFKTIIAATYLENPKNSAEDLISAPLTVQYDGRTFRNYNGGQCPGTVDGMVRLLDALAFSCNTAFIELTESIGWDAVRDTAQRFGFQLAGESGAGAGLVGANLGAPSKVPREAFGAALAVNSLGGGEVVGTPLRMAAVMSAIANEGTLVQPSVVSSQDQSRTEVLSPETAEQLRRAMSRTAESGTARGLVSPDGETVYVKTGTHEIVVDGEPTPQGQFERQIAWVVGFVGSTAFAVAVTTRDEETGGERARFLAQTIIDQVAEDNG